VSPTARTLAECKRRGWIAQVVEHRVRAGRLSFLRDLFGGIDLVALTPRGIVGIQACAGTDHAKRRAKLLDEPRIAAWMAAKGGLEVWSWAKQGPRGKRKLWTLRAEVLS
jgi:hypothetical protein